LRYAGSVVKQSCRESSGRKKEVKEFLPSDIGKKRREEQQIRDCGKVGGKVGPSWQKRGDAVMNARE